MKCRFRLRTFLIAIAVFTVPFAWLAANIAESRHEVELVGKLENEPGTFELMDSSYFSMCGMGIVGTAERKPVSKLGEFGSILSPAIFERVTEVWLESEEYDDDSLLIVAEFPHLRKLILLDTRISRHAVDEFQRLRPEVEVMLSTEGYLSLTCDEVKQEETLVGDDGSSP